MYPGFSLSLERGLGLSLGRRPTLLSVVLVIPALKVPVEHVVNFAKPKPLEDALAGGRAWLDEAKARHIGQHTFACTEPEDQR